MSEGAAAQAAQTVAADDLQCFRRVLGRFASGITIVTTKLEGRVHGMTASAFMSGSLHPPLVVISIGRTAKLHDYIEHSGAFGISILDEAQEGHSRHFAGQPVHVHEPLFDEQVDIPLVQGALAGLVATVEDAHRCGDHTLFVGQVRHLQVREGAPLIHFAGGYHQLANSAA